VGKFKAFTYGLKHIYALARLRFKISNDHK